MKILRSLLIGALLTPLAALAAPSVSISVSPATGVAPYPATLTWGSSGAVSCAASDGWTGSKATSGTQAVTISATTKFTLKCTAADGSTTLTWTPPTTNVDGTPLTDLTSYNLYRGTTAANQAKVKAIPPSVSTATDAGLASGTYVYAMTAVDAESSESVKSNTSSVVIAGSSTTASATAVVQSPPNPPTGLSATSIVAYELKRNSQGVMTAARIGILPIGTACAPDSLTAAGATYNKIDAASVDLINWPASTARPVEAWAKCG